MPALPINAAGMTSVFFDLDGTLADTAPDIIAALDWLRHALDMPPLDYPRMRDLVSHGSAALVQYAFPLADSVQHTALTQRFLDRYRAQLCVRTRLFTGMPSLLAHIEQAGLRWGVVTNKPARLTRPLLHILGLAQRAAVIVSGDTLSERKPHPAPLWHACHLAGCEPRQCLYVGDAERDIQAGLAAGITTLIADYGYIDPDQRPTQWGAHGRLATPGELLQWLSAQQP